jgi:antitoxin ParD1/3/4
LGTWSKIIVVKKNTSVSLGSHFESFIEDGVVNGRYKNASEVIRAGLSLLEEEENRVTLLKGAIQQGRDSGIAQGFDPKKHLEELKSRRTTNG